MRFHMILLMGGVLLFIAGLALSASEIRAYKQAAASLMNRDDMQACEGQMLRAWRSGLRSLRRAEEETWNSPRGLSVDELDSLPGPRSK